MAERARTTRFSGRLKLLAAVAVLAAGIAIVLHAVGAFDSLELKTIDARFHVRGTRKPRQPIVIVGVDQRTLANPNLSIPLPRQMYARVFDRLHRGGARLIISDIEFVGRKEPAGDRALIRAISAARPMVLATADKNQGWLPVPAGANPKRLGAVVASAGAQADSDGIYRRIIYQPVDLPVVPVRAAEVLRKKAVPESKFPGNYAWNDYAGPPGTFRTISLSDVLSGTVPASAFRGKIVIVGYTAPVLGDIFQSPVSSSPMAGPEGQANALETILDGFPLQSAPGWLNVLLIIVLSVLPAALALRLPSLLVLGFSLLAAVLFLVAVQLAFNSGTIVATVDPLFGLVLGTVGAVAADAFVERRQRRRLEEALGRLLPKPTAFFISYRRDDTRWPANSLRAALAERFGPASVFMDTATINPGQEWPTRIEQAMRGASVVLVLIGQRWLERDSSGRRRLDDPGDWVRLEVEAGLRRTDAATVPVLVEGTIMPDAAELPNPLVPLTRRHAIALSAERYAQELDEFVDAIERGLIQDYVARQEVPAISMETAEAAGVATDAPVAAGAAVAAAPSEAPVVARAAPEASVPAEPSPASGERSKVEPSGAPRVARLSAEPPTWSLNGTHSQPAPPKKPDYTGDPPADPLKAQRGD